jgi:hypothetical protein
MRVVSRSSLVTALPRYRSGIDGSLTAAEIRPRRASTGTVRTLSQPGESGSVARGVPADMAPSEMREIRAPMLLREG